MVVGDLVVQGFEVVHPGVVAVRGAVRGVAGVGGQLELPFRVGRIGSVDAGAFAFAQHQLSGGS